MATKGKLTKKTNEVIAGNIDNTAPVHHILDDLESKNIQALKFYCENIKQKSDVFFPHHTVPGHPLNKFSDNWDGDLPSNYFQNFGYKSTMPMIITKMENIERSDPVTDLLKARRKWLSELTAQKSVAVKFKLMQKYENLNEEVIRCPQHFVDMAAHIDSVPDPYFTSFYNWYYAGHGNIQLINIEYTDYVMHSVFSCLYLSEISLNNNAVSLYTKSSFECGEGTNILETISTQNIIALRTKHKIFILKIDPSYDRISLDGIKTIDSELPFTSISFDKHHKNILYVTSIDQKLKIVNLDRLTGRTVQLNGRIESLTDNWNSVIGSERAIYTHLTNHAVTCYDKRTNESIALWNSIGDICDEPKCNTITAAAQQEDSPFLYLGTNHHLILMDLRCRRSPKPVQRWTHSMECVPCYINVQNFDLNKELICVSSQWCEDLCLIGNYNSLISRDELPGISMPYRPRSLLNTLNSAREQQLCIDLYNPIDRRLCTSSTGSIVMENADKYLVLTLNSLGDISCHTLYPEHLDIFIEDDSIKHLHEWSKSYKVKQKPFEVSAVVDISNAWKQLKKVPASYIQETRKLILDRNNFNEQEIFNTFENEEVDSGLLDIWMKDSIDVYETSQIKIDSMEDE